MPARSRSAAVAPICLLVRNSQAGRLRRNSLCILCYVFRSDGSLRSIFPALGGGGAQFFPKFVNSPGGLCVVSGIVTADKGTVPFGNNRLCDVHINDMDTVRCCLEGGCCGNVGGGLWDVGVGCLMLLWFQGPRAEVAAPQAKSFRPECASSISTLVQHNHRSPSVSTVASPSRRPCCRSITVLSSLPARSVSAYARARSCFCRIRRPLSPASP